MPKLQSSIPGKSSVGINRRRDIAPAGTRHAAPKPGDPIRVGICSVVREVGHSRRNAEAGQAPGYTARAGTRRDGPRLQPAALPNFAASFVPRAMSSGIHRGVLRGKEEEQRRALTRAQAARAPTRRALEPHHHASPAVESRPRRRVSPATAGSRHHARV
eukprot:365631-Chlamydomonas_euryale.AAC.9